MTNTTLTKPDKQDEDRSELGQLYCAIQCSKSLLKNTVIKVEKSKEETRRLQEILKKELEEIKNYEDRYEYKSELYRKNYGKFYQLKLI